MPTNTKAPCRVVDLARALRTSRGYASLILAGKRTPTLVAVLTTHHVLGVRLAPISTASDGEIAVLEKYASGQFETKN